MPDPTNPNRLEGLPSLGQPALGVQPVAVVERSPTGLAVLPQVAVKVMTVLVGLAAIGIPIFTTMLPAPWAVTGLAICSSVVGIGTVFGIASPGVRTGAGVVEGQVISKTEAPRVGPQV